MEFKSKVLAPIDWQATKTEILAKLDLVEEYRALGLRLTKETPNAKGLIVCHAMDREDHHPSAFINVKTGIYHDSGGESLNFWDFCLRYGDGFGRHIDVVRFYAAKAGVELDRVEFSSRGRIREAEYTYQDETGVDLFVVTRYRLPSGRKDFSQRPANGKTGPGCMEGVRLVPYRLPELVVSESTDFVWIVEGEKDVDRLVKEGLTATCNPMGAGKWRSEFADYFAGRHVVVIPDNDAAGKAHAATICNSLHGIAATVQYLELPDLLPHGDVSDWLDLGGTIEELGKLAYNAAIWVPTSSGNGDGNHKAEAEEDEEAEDLRSPFQPEIFGARQFAAKDFTMEWLVKRVLVAKQPCVLAAPKKGMKTSLIIDLAVSLASGTKFLGEFDVPCQVPVLVLSGESGGFVIKDTVNRVCGAKNILLDDLEGYFFVGFELPQLSMVAQVEALAGIIRDHEIKVVLIDPLYLCLLSGGGRRLDAANLFDMGPLLMGIAAKSLDAGATPVLVHHFRKNVAEPYDVPEMESMAFAGIQEFARQWILLGRRQKFEPGTGLHQLWMSVGGSAGHSGAWAIDINEGVMGEDFLGRQWNVSVKLASECRVETTEQNKAAREEKQAEAERTEQERIERQTIRNAEIALEFLRQKGTAISKTEWRTTLKWDPNKFDPVFYSLKNAGFIEPVKIAVATGTGERTIEGWRASANADDAPDR